MQKIEVAGESVLSIVTDEAHFLKPCFSTFEEAEVPQCEPDVLSLPMTNAATFKPVGGRDSLMLVLQMESAVPKGTKKPSQVVNTQTSDRSPSGLS